MIYDVAIIGGGPAGGACGINLVRHQMDCIILEKRTELKGKVCGDGLSSHCLWVLDKLGIDLNELMKIGGKVVSKNITSNFGRLEQRYYEEKKGYKNVAMGLSRDIFDEYLMKVAIKEGCIFKNNHEVKKIEFDGDIYVVDEVIKAKKIVLACGAIKNKRFGLKIPYDVPVGVSARVKGDCNLAPDAFYFKYNWQFGNGYAWLFPVGEKTWNYGVWSSNRRHNVKDLFYEVEQRLLATYFLNYRYDRKPKGAIIGSTKEDICQSQYACIGDCKYVASFNSGEGISFAIETGVKQAEAIINKENQYKIDILTECGFKREKKIINMEQIYVG